MCQDYLKQHIIDENDDFEYDFIKEEKEQQRLEAEKLALEE